MIRIRRYDPSDREALIALSAKHSEAHEVDYYLLDPEHAATFTTYVAVNDGGRLVAALSGRKVAEGFLTLDPEWGKPLDRWTLFEAMLKRCLADAQRQGFNEIVAGIPEHVQRFGRRLSESLGFKYDTRERLILDLTGGPAPEKAP